MGRNALALMEYLDRPCREPDPNLLAQQAMRGGVIVFADLDMVVETYSALLPFRKNIRFDRQGLQAGALNLVKDPPTAGTKVPGHPIIQAVKEDADRRVQLG